MSARINHYHQRGTDGQRSKIARIGFDDAHPNGEHEEECPDKFH